MKITVSGSGTGENQSILEKAKEIGREIAKHGHVLLSGGCRGYPYAAVRGALLENGKVIVYSPAKNEEEHKLEYDFPTDSGVEYIYTGLGIPERNIPLVKDGDAVIFINGQVGTLNEFAIAFKEGKIMGVLKNSGGVCELIPQLAEVCDKNGEKEKIIYFDNIKEFLKRNILEIKNF